MLLWLSMFSLFFDSCYCLKNGIIICASLQINQVIVLWFSTATFNHLDYMVFLYLAGTKRSSSYIFIVVQCVKAKF